MTSTDDLEVPMAWFWAEHLAEDLIWSVDSPSPPNSFEVVMARAVLALTLLFTGIAEHGGQLSDDELELIWDLILSGGGRPASTLSRACHPGLSMAVARLPTFGRGD
jgi:hypothetical protein